MGRSWRLLATAASFAVFGVGALVATALCITITVASRDAAARQRRTRACIRSSFWFFLRFTALLRVVKIDIDEDTLKTLAAERGTVVVANHPTYIDALVLLAHIDQANCVVKQALWRNPLLSWGLRAARYIPNDDPIELLRACDLALQRGETLIVFPEATRTVPGEPLRLQRGAANIALRSAAHIRLVHFRCEPRFLAKGDPWYRVPDRRPCLAMRVGGSLRARDYLENEKNMNVAARRLTRLLQRELSKEIRFDESAGTGVEAAPN